MPSSTRRSFVCGCSAAIAALAGSRFNSLTFGQPGNYNQELLVVLFLRGGMDGLNLVPPIRSSDRGHYEAARPRLQVPKSGANKALDLGGRFGLHPAAAPLYDLYQNGNLAIVHAAGMHTGNRSHFDSMRFMELGTPGVVAGSTGWLTRHLSSATNLPSEIVMPSVAAGSLQQASLLGSLETINMASASDFTFNTGPWEWRSAQRFTLRRLLGEDNTWLHEQSVAALDALDIVELSVEGGYSPANGAVYPNDSLGRNLKMVAQMLKLDLGLRVATIDYGGWDTHNGQGDGSGGYFAGHVGDLAEALAAFYLDLDGGGSSNYADRMTLVMMSEFGRRLVENNDAGTDHGHGNVMFVLGGNASGGVHGDWPGLGSGSLFQGADLEVTTDYRRVLSEILIKRMGNDQIDQIFPGYTGYEPLGVVEAKIFEDGFEGGDLSRWSEIHP